MWDYDDEDRDWIKDELQKMSTEDLLAESQRWVERNQSDPPEDVTTNTVANQSRNLQEIWVNVQALIELRSDASDLHR